jgi:hypothetical protein
MGTYPSHQAEFDYVASGAVVPAQRGILNLPGENNCFLNSGTVRYRNDFKLLLMSLNGDMFIVQYTLNLQYILPIHLIML